jgi:CheY-like chemotaxis protein
MTNASESVSAARSDISFGRLSISYRALLALGTFPIMIIIIAFAFYFNTHVKVAFSKLQFEIFESNRDRALSANAHAPASAISKDIPSDLRDRIQRSTNQLAGASILWVDDAGASRNTWERRALNSLGLAIDTATSTDQALGLLQSGVPYDIIITDLKRSNGDPVGPCYPGSTQYINAGCRFIQLARAMCDTKLAPVIVYSMGANESAGEPPYVLGMTDRFDRLTSLILDAVERRPASDAKVAEGTQCSHNPVTKPRA